SFTTPNTEASIVLAALAGDESSVHAFLDLAPQFVSRASVMGHEAFVLENRYADGQTAGTSLFWEDDSHVWMTVTGASELSRDDTVELAGHLVRVTEAEWHQAVAPHLFSS